MALKREKVKKHPEANELLRWYDLNRRSMPWRAKAGEKIIPYHVWLSEIMLQQTNVVTVGPYFENFIRRWPTLDDLAHASLDDVLRVWAGLGYYRRARLLHQCAEKLQSEYGGVFPQDELELRKLPGFGPYTAAAVAAIAFGKPANVVDGNVERVMARVFAVKDMMPIAKKKLRTCAATLVPQKRAGDYAQALMDLGATVCSPRSPKCSICPWIEACQARALGIEESLPFRTKAQPKPVRRTVAFVLVDRQGRVLLRQRPAHGLLAGMTEVPSSPWLEQTFPTLSIASIHAPMSGGWRVFPDAIKHVFSHFTLEVRVAGLIASAAQTRRIGKKDGVWIAPHELSSEALPSIMKKIVLYALKTL